MTPQFTVPQGVFVDAIADALIAAAKPGAYVPAIEAVHLAGDKGAESVTVTGTDRFLLIQRVIHLDEPLTEAIDALIPYEHAQTIVGVLKLKARQQVPPLVVKVGELPGYLTAGNLSVPLNTADQYVKVGSFFENTEQSDESINLLGLNVELVGKLGKLSAFRRVRGCKTIGLRFSGASGNRVSPGSPDMLRVRIGDNDDLRIILMAARV